MWRQVGRGLRSLVLRRATERDIADEVEHWLDQEIAELVARGVPPAEAKRRVRLAHGDAATVRERVGSYGWETAVEARWVDLRYAARRLRRSPGFTAVAVLTLGLGIGAATAIFGVVRPALLAPLAYPDPDRLVAVHDHTGDGAPAPVTFGSHVEIAQRHRSFDALAVLKPWRPTLTGAGEPVRLEGQRVSAGFLDVLGVSTALGPGFDPESDRVGGPDVVVLGDGLWRRRFGADSSIVGRAVRLDDRPFTVVGVMPPGFESVSASMVEAWAPLQYDASLPSFDGREWGHHLEMIGRLRAGVGVESARRDLTRIATSPLPELTRPGWANMVREATGLGLDVRPLAEAVTAEARPSLLALAGAVTLLLGIACVNVTNLLLARGARRRAELAMRAALGAPRGRLLAQLLTESLLLAAMGGALGVALAHAGVGALVALAPPDLPSLEAVGLDGAAFAFALGVTTLIGGVVGLVPALAPTAGRLRRGLAASSTRAAGGHLAIRRTLVVAEVALALVLLVGAGLVLRSLQRLFALPTGFDASGLVVMQVQTVGRRFDDDAETHRFFAQALEAVRDVPGVASVALSSQLPLSGDLDVYGVAFDDDLRPEGSDGDALRYAVSPGYAGTMGVPLLRGRFLHEGDVAGAPPSVVVSASFAASAFPGGDPIGRRVHVGRTDLPWFTIVGVVGDVKQISLDARRTDAVYVTPEQWYFTDRARWLVARATRDAAPLVPALERAIWSVDRDQPIVRVHTMDELVARSESKRRFALVVLEAFGLLALALAGLGLYGVLAGSVAERKRELGVRAALGASRERIQSLVVGQGMALTGLGVALGLVGAVLASEALATLLFGVSRLDPATYVGVVALLATVALIACWVPAWRAARVDPAGTLRSE
jgi:predicted permease